MADPLNVLAIDDVRRITKLEVAPMIASEKAIIDKLQQPRYRQERQHGGHHPGCRTSRPKLEADADNLETVKETIEEVNLDQLAASTEEAPVIKLANLILVQAIKDRASDIHIEPFEKMVRLRYRVDGVLIDATPPPKNLQVALISRLKIMSNLDIAERRLPQDGRMRVKVGGRGFRFARFLPAHGARRESACCVCSTNRNLSASMDKLGMDPDTFRRFKRRRGCAARVDPGHRPDRLRQNHDALFRAQRTEQSRITTSSRSKTRSNSRFPASTRCRCKKEIGLTFANALRSILRQDPDIVMIGEIRDTETAEIAVEAALTGHQVLSTMHCNDAAGAIARLDDMGIAPFLISSSVILACAQRLMRRICSHCKEPVTYPAKMYPRPGHSTRAIFDGVHALSRPRLRPLQQHRLRRPHWPSSKP